MIGEAGIELTDDELDDIAGGFEHQVHHRYRNEPTDGKSERKPIVFEIVH